MPRVGYVLNGVYHKKEPSLSLMQAQQQSTWKEADHDRQRREFAADIVQPFKHGKPNQEFIDLNPEAAVDYGFVEKPDDGS
jgi:hypothetical protein